MLDDMIAATTGLAMRNAFLKGEGWRPVRKEAMKSVISNGGVSLAADPRITYVTPSRPRLWLK